MFKLPLFKDIHICSLLCVTSNIKFTTALNIKETHSLCFQIIRFFMNKMMKEEIEEDKIDIETSFPLPTCNSAEKLNERFDIL
jgi:hypothetical protein